LARQLHRDLGRRLGTEAQRQGLSEDLIAGMEDDRQAIYQEISGGDVET
jgi:hypothetical protein